MVFRETDSGDEPTLVWFGGKLIPVLGKPTSVEGKLSTQINISRISKSRNGKRLVPMFVV